jgi:uncharacterized membrane protein YraQ (UPF0718 family)
MKNLKKYRLFIITLIVLGILYIFNKEMAIKSAKTTLSSLKQMLIYIPPIFVLLGLLDVWVEKEAIIKLMGENSRIKGVLLSIVIGSCAAGPLYGAFPIAAVFMKKGVKFSNILIFIGTWSCAKIGMILFEIASMGVKFAFARLIIDIPLIIIIAFIIPQLITKEHLDEIYQAVENI